MDKHSRMVGYSSQFLSRVTIPSMHLRLITAQGAVEQGLPTQSTLACWESPEIGERTVIPSEGALTALKVCQDYPCHCEVSRVLIAARYANPVVQVLVTRPLLDQ